MKKFLFLVSLMLPVAALAAGGGGGGSEFSEPQPQAPAPAPVPVVTSSPVVVPPKPLSVDAPVPAEEVNAPNNAWNLRCDQATMRGRVKCRLGLTEAEIEKELAVKYLPEECRALASDKQSACIERYKSLQPCWHEWVWAKRSACAAKKLGFRLTPAVEFRQCLKQTGLDRSACQAVVRDKVFALIKFRLYNLSERAEAMLAAGVSQERVADLVTSMETHKQQFNQATTYAGRKKILLGARVAWRKFVATTRGKETTADNLDGALSDLSVVQ